MNWIFIFFSEMVSKPNISWSCTNTTLTCEVTKGTDFELKLYLNGRMIQKSPRKVIVYKRASNQIASFKCTANNTVSEESSSVVIRCTGAWRALVRRPKFTSHTPSARPTATGHSRAQVPGLGGSLGSG